MIRSIPRLIKDLRSADRAGYATVDAVARRWTYALWVTTQVKFRNWDRHRDEIRGRKVFFCRAFKALAFNGIDGDYAEFGCCGGMTFRLAHGASRLARHRVHLWAFDSFEGLPEVADERDEHPEWASGKMAMSEADFHLVCASAGIPRGDYTVVSGFYDESLRADAPGARPDQIALAYIDCDLYISTVDVLAFLAPRLRHGTVLAFDDYYCFGPNTVAGERQAVAEAFADLPEWRLVPFLQFGWHGMSFVVERRDLLPEDPTSW